MPKKTKWYESLWKVFVVLSVISSLIASMLQIFRVVDFWGLLVAPLYIFLTSCVPVYYILFFIILIVILRYSVVRFRAYKTSILKLEYARRIARLCQTPQTTEYLRQQYNLWERQSNVIVIDGLSFDDYLKQLEEQGYLRYQDGKWIVTRKALDYIAKYHGDYTY